jgi:acyl carrier protein
VHKYLPDLFSSTGGAFMYRTGDRARFLADGNIEFLGRLDHQVKLRGFRIELGEVETVLRAHPEVAGVLAMAREDRPGDKRLVVYVVPRKEGSPAAEDLRRFLRERLPDYMVPSAVVLLPELPVTPNGKVDRKALPAPERPAPSSDGSDRPRGPVEEILAGIWCDVLQLQSVGAQDDFFELGGHSLLATQVVTRIRESFGVELPLRGLFEASTLTELAARIEQLRRAGRAADAPPIVPVSREGDLPLSFAQQRLWFVHELNPGSVAYHIPVAVRLEGSLNAPVLAAVLNEVVRRQASLRTTFAKVADKPVQRIAPSGSIRLPVVDLRKLPEALRESEARRTAQRERLRPFDLERGPLLRVLLVRLGEREHLAVLTMHHIASDGWSMGVLVREVAVLYAAWLQGRLSPLPELPVQYTDFAHWQRQRLQGAVLEELLAYWTERLAGSPPLLELPDARPRPAVQSDRGALQVHRLPSELMDRLRDLGQEESATLFMVLLAAFDALVHARTGASDIVVGTDIANRNQTGTEELIGFFINQLPLRTDLFGNPTFRELLSRVREVTLGAYAHQDLPFDRLVDALKVRRTPQHTPVFQVKLVLQNAPAPRLDLPDLRLSAVDLEASTSQVDLNINMAEVPDGLLLSAQFSTDVYDAPTVERLLKQLEVLLGAAVESPGATLRELCAGLGEAQERWRTELEHDIKEAGREKLLALRRRAVAPAGR